MLVHAMISPPASHLILFYPTRFLYFVAQCLIAMQTSNKVAGSEATDMETQAIGQDAAPHQRVAVLDDSDMHRMGKAQQFKVCRFTTPYGIGPATHPG